MEMAVTAIVTDRDFDRCNCRIGKIFQKKKGGKF